MNKNEIFSFLTNNVSGYSVGEMILNLCVIFVLSLLIFAVYKNTVKRVNYYSNFAIVLMLTAIVTGVIMMIIESNLVLSLGMVGALSIIRFRSAIKDPVDTAYIFWAVAVGIASGTGNHLLSLVSSLLIGVFVVVFSFITKTQLKEVLIIRGKTINVAAVTAVLDGENVHYTAKSKSLNGTYQEFIYEINSKSSDNLIDRLSAVEGIEGINIVSGVNI
ncbi:MAG: DUF4956 domain-containing protein [Oscillospiraceae bacterium]|nr:DUF4956 domain-containing protein [Oscillospiraceae bacterium]